MPYIPPSIGGSVVKGAVKNATGVDLNDFKSHDEEDPKNPKAIEADSRRDEFLMAVTIGFGAVTLAFAALAAYIEYSYVCFFALIWPVCAVPLAVSQRRSLNSMRTFRGIHNALRDEINRLHGINDALKQTNTQLYDSVSAMERVEHEFNEVVKSQGGDVSQFQGLVKENRLITNEIQNIQKQRQMQHILTTILRCDTDESFTLSDQQLRLCLKRLEQHNVDVNRLSKLLGRDKSVSQLVSSTYEVMGFTVKNPFRL